MPAAQKTTPLIPPAPEVPMLSPKTVVSDPGFKVDESNHFRTFFVGLAQS